MVLRGLQTATSTSKVETSVTRYPVCLWSEKEATEEKTGENQILMNSHNSQLCNCLLHNMNRLEQNSVTSAYGTSSHFPHAYRFHENYM